MNNLNLNEDVFKNYISPFCREIPIDVREVLCTSGPTEKVNEIEGEW